MTSTTVLRQAGTGDQDLFVGTRHRRRIPMRFDFGRDESGRGRRLEGAIIAFVAPQHDCPPAPLDDNGNLNSVDRRSRAYKTIMPIDDLTEPLQRREILGGHQFMSQASAALVQAKKSFLCARNNIPCFIAI